MDLTGTATSKGEGEGWSSRKGHVAPCPYPDPSSDQTRPFSIRVFRAVIQSAYPIKILMHSVVVSLDSPFKTKTEKKLYNNTLWDDTYSKK